MNMSDDIAGAVLNVTSRGAIEAMRTSRLALEAILRLLRYLAMARRNNIQNHANRTDIQNNEILDIKSGQVSIRELHDHCLKNREQLVFSEHGMTKADAAILARKAKDCGIPLAFRSERGKDNVYVCLRQCDMPLFRQISTELIKEKLSTRPQEFSNFICNEWEIPFINAELKQHDLSAQFAKTKDGRFLAIYEKNDAKAVEIARSEFVRKAQEVENAIEFKKTDEGFIATDKITGHTFPINTETTKSLVSKKFMEELGFDDNKAAIAAQKFGKEMLDGEVKTKYFSNDPTLEFSYVSKVTWDKESVLCKPYDCYYVTPKQDSVSRIVFQDGEGRSAILNPPRQSNAKMRAILTEQLGISDVALQNALIAKAEHVSSANNKYRNIMGANENLHNHEITFTKSDFNMSDPNVVSGMLRTEGNDTFTKSQPIDSISTSIERNGNSFNVTSTVIATERDNSGQTHTVSQEKSLKLSFSNKKAAIEELKELYISQGVPEAAAKDMANSVYQKAELQSAEPLIAIEEKAYADISNISLIATSPQDAIKSISEKYNVSAEQAEIIYDKYQDNAESMAQHVQAVKATSTDFYSAINRTVNRSENKSDNMVVCSMSKPDKHIVVSGQHNGERVIHDYSVYDGNKKIADFSDANTTDESGRSIPGEWTGLRRKMQTESEIGNEVLVFNSMDEYKTFMAESEFVSKMEESAENSNVDTNINEEAAVDTNINAESAESSVDTNINGNGHEAHPEGNILSEVNEKISDKGSEAVNKTAEKIDETVEQIEESSIGGR